MIVQQYFGMCMNKYDTCACIYSTLYCIPLYTNVHGYILLVIHASVYILNTCEASINMSLLYSSFPILIDIFFTKFVDGLATVDP